MEKQKTLLDVQLNTLQLYVFC